MFEFIVEFDCFALNISRSFKSLSINIGSVCALYRLHAIIRIIFFCNFNARPQSNPHVRIA